MKAMVSVGATTHRDSHEGGRHDLSWQNTVDAMNTALQRASLEWRYELNGALTTLKKQ